MSLRASSGRSASPATRKRRRPITPGMKSCPSMAAVYTIHAQRRSAPVRVTRSTQRPAERGGSHPSETPSAAPAISTIASTPPPAAYATSAASAIPETSRRCSRASFIVPPARR